MPHLDSAPGRRSARRVTPVNTPAPRGGGAAPGVAAHQPSTTGVSPHVPSSPLIELADSLKLFSSALGQRAEQQRRAQEEQDLTAGQAAAARGEFERLSEVEDRSEAFRRGAASVLADKVGMRAITSLQEKLIAGANTPGFDFESAREEVATEFFGDGADRHDMVVAGAASMFVKRSEALKSAWHADQFQKLRQQSADDMLTNLGEQTRSLTEYAGPDLQDQLYGMQQKAIEQAAALGVDMDQVNLMRIETVERLARERLDPSLFDVFLQKDARNGKALADHPKFIDDIVAAKLRVESAVRAANAVDDKLAKLDLLEALDQRVKVRGGVSKQELRDLLEADKLSVGEVRSYTEKQKDTNDAAAQLDSDLAIVHAGGVIPEKDSSEYKKRYARVVDHITNKVAKQNPEQAAKVQNDLYAQAGFVSEDLKASIDRSMLSSKRESMAAGFELYTDLRGRNPVLAEQSVSSAARSRLDAVEGLRMAGYSADDSYLHMEKVTANIDKARERVTNKATLTQVDKGLKEMGLPVDGTGNREFVRRRVLESAATMVATDMVSPTAAVEYALKLAALSLRTSGNFRYDSTEAPIGLDDPEVMESFRKHVVRPFLNVNKLDPDTEDDYAVAPINRNEVYIIDGDTGAPVGKPLPYSLWYEEMMRRRASKLGVTTEQAIKDALETNQSAQGKRAARQKRFTPPTRFDKDPLRRRP